MSKIWKSLTLGSIGKFELRLILTSGMEISKINAAEEVNKFKKQTWSKEYKNISSNVERVSNLSFRASQVYNI